MSHDNDARTDALHQRLVALNRTDRVQTVELLKALMEADRLRLYAARGYDSMYVYCQKGLRMEEGVIYLRIAAARCVARFGCILPMLQDGSLSMTAVHLLRSRLTEQNHRELLAKAQHMSKRQVQQLLADAQPLSNVAERVQKLPERPAPSAPAPKTADAEPVAPPQQGNGSAVQPAPEGTRPASGCAPAEAPRAAPSPASRPSGHTEPLGAKRYGVHFTATEQLHDKLIEAQALLSHTQAGSNLAMVFERALDELLKTLRKRKYAETDAPRRPKAHSGEGRANNRPPIPASVRRAVLERDGGRCTFVGPDGHRCESRRLLEFHHIVPVGKGGATTVEGVTLHCRAHNLLAAERDYGLELMQQRVSQARSQASGSRSQPSAVQGEPHRDSRGGPGQPGTEPPARSVASEDASPTCPARMAPESQATAKAESRPTRPCATSPGHLEAPVPGRRRRGKQQQPECVVLPGQLALPVQAACRVADEPSATPSPLSQNNTACRRAGRVARPVSRSDSRWVEAALSSVRKE